MIFTCLIKSYFITTYLNVQSLLVGLKVKVDIYDQPYYNLYGILFWEVKRISKSILAPKTEGRGLPCYLSLFSSLSWTGNVSIMKTNHSFIRKLGYLRLQDHLPKYRLWERVNEIDKSYLSIYNTD